MVTFLGSDIQLYRIIMLHINRLLIKFIRSSLANPEIHYQFSSLTRQCPSTTDAFFLALGQTVCVRERVRANEKDGKQI